MVPPELPNQPLDGCMTRSCLLPTWAHGGPRYTFLRQRKTCESIPSNPSLCTRIATSLDSLLEASDEPPRCMIWRQHYARFSSWAMHQHIHSHGLTMVDVNVFLVSKIAVRARSMAARLRCRFSRVSLSLFQLLSLLTECVLVPGPVTCLPLNPILKTPN